MMYVLYLEVSSEKLSTIDRKDQRKFVEIFGESLKKVGDNNLVKPAKLITLRLTPNPP